MRIAAVLERLSSVADMAAADLMAPDLGVPSMVLMENAGRAVADEIGRRFRPRPTTVLCGPGNNGGDGYVLARLLSQRGWPVRCQTLGDVSRLRGDAAEACRRWQGVRTPLATDGLGSDLIVDALFGAGLSRPLEGQAAAFAARTEPWRERIVAIDVPSGIHGDTGQPVGRSAVHAALTVTFVARKPAHVLMPGRMHCGETVLCDIGMPTRAAARAVERTDCETLSGGRLISVDPAAHKYTHGHCLVVSGGAETTGAARLSAMAAARAGAGLTTIAANAAAAAIHAAHLTSIMIRSQALPEILADRRKNTIIIGPGLGTDEDATASLLAVLAADRSTVLDADALTLLADAQPVSRLPHDRFVLTPHAGEFARVFPDLAADLVEIGKMEAARLAAARIGATLVFKGADTVIATPDGRVAIDALGPPSLATAGTGDVLAGFVGGLLAQGAAPFEAACSGVWLHGATARLLGPGLLADDLPGAVPAVRATLRQVGG